MIFANSPSHTGWSVPTNKQKKTQRMTKGLSFHAKSFPVILSYLMFTLMLLGTSQFSVKAQSVLTLNIGPTSGGTPSSFMGPFGNGGNSAQANARFAYLYTASEFKVVRA